MSNPILNSPYEEPKWHYYTNLNGTLNYEEIMPGRRPFSPEVPSVPFADTNQNNLFGAELADDYSTHIINRLREEIKKWRQNGYHGTTRISKELLDFWFNNPDRISTHRLFFAQQEAIETAIYLNEVAPKENFGNFVLSELEKFRSVEMPDPENRFERIAFKMATGTGKTVVMACLILYHYLNRHEYRNDTRFADKFLIITPGITIKDRLGVLFVDTINRGIKRKDYYSERNLVPRQHEALINGLNSRLTITNYHALEQRTLQGNKKTPFDGKKDIYGNAMDSGNLEDFGLTLRRLLGESKSKNRLLVINDEAHHCYFPKSKKKTEDNEEVNENVRAAVWFTGIKEISKRFTLQGVYDLSATPYYLRGSGYRDYSLFGWVVTDFGLIDAIEAGLVKIPFLPVSDNSQELEESKLRNIYEHVRDELPKMGQKKRKSEANKDGVKLVEEPPKLPLLVQTALFQFHDHYNKYAEGLRKAYEAKQDLLTAPPVFIVVCNNTSVSKEVYKYLAGYEFTDEKGNLQIAHGKFEEFNNFEITGLAKKRPPTLLIDSDALEDSGQISDDFKRVFKSEIDEFKKDYAQQHGGGSMEDITDAEILREVVNTVGKPGKLGAHVKCIVSVSMLTEGWDANTVTHIMGLRAFGSQLLCEQVAGRALRRSNYILQGYDKDGNPVDDKRKIVVEKFPPEYAHIIGIPFKMMKGGTTSPPVDPGEITIITAIPEREEAYEIEFPNIIGYRIDRGTDEIRFDFSDVSDFEVDGTKYPTDVTLQTAFSPETSGLTLEEFLEKRDQEIIYDITRSLIKFHFSEENGTPYFELFPACKEVVSNWYENKIRLIGITEKKYRKLVYLFEPKVVVDHIFRGINTHRNNSEFIKPVLNFYNKIGSTKYVHGRTSKEVYRTVKSHVNFVIADSDWEKIAAKALDEMPQVISYVKNNFLSFQIPYVKEGKERIYFPDFIAVCNTVSGETINLIIEITGMSKDKDGKKWFVENRWLPAANSIKDKFGFNTWHFIEIADEIRDIKNRLTEKLESL
ncbi:MAG: DEAD/DEAH box helicase family protein [Bacteroidetes bacterium]|nr:DEAD/DEAH box helicase family protein [Bacteroidota bacterium]